MREYKYMASEKIRICKRCVLPESLPDIWLDETEVCNICRQQEKQTDPEFLETDFIKIINKYKGQRKYDCLVMCSGGKDSTSALYYMKKRYHLNPLAFTFDHGFENPDALENIKNAVNILGIDHVFLNSEEMHDAFREIVESELKAVICHICSIWYMRAAFKLAIKHKIPLIIAGWTKGQSIKHSGRYSEKIGEYGSMAKATKDFIESFMSKQEKYKNFPASIEEATKQARKKMDFVVMSPHWFLPFGEEENEELIKKELNWKLPKQSYPKGSTNCFLNYISVLGSMKNYGYTHYHVELSKLIREGQISREDALEKLKIDFDQELLDSTYKKLKGDNK